MILMSLRAKFSQDVGNELGSVIGNACMFIYERNRGVTVVLNVNIVDGRKHIKLDKLFRQVHGDLHSVVKL